MTDQTCHLRGPYLPVGDIDWQCMTHDVGALRVEGTPDDQARYAEMRCPVARPEAFLQWMDWLRSTGVATEEEIREWAAEEWALLARRAIFLQSELEICGRASQGNAAAHMDEAKRRRIAEAGLDRALESLRVAETRLRVIEGMLRG